MTPERKLWHELKRNTPQITWTRIENFAGFGTPDLLGYNTNRHFFTVELKVTKANKIRFSPHQISFHITHPNDTFILVKALGPCTMKLFPGSLIQELVKEGYACGSVVPGPWSTVLEPLLAC
jgi:Holliday junction resolvase